jgi:hypothetical protein
MQMQGAVSAEVAMARFAVYRAPRGEMEAYGIVQAKA